MKFFPPPKYLQMRASGLDISDRSVKFVDVVPSSQYFQLATFGEEAISPGVLELGQIKDKMALKQALVKLREKYHLNYVHFALPEERAYIVKLALPALNRHDLRQSIELQLEEHVPLPVAQVLFDYEIISESATDKSRQYQLAVSVFPRREVEDYVEVITDAGLTPLSSEIETHAIARALVQIERTNKTFLITDIGRTRTSFFVVSGRSVLLTSTVSNVGGDLITNALQKNLNFSFAEAEDYKMKHGILITNGNTKTLAILAPIISVLRDEIARFHNFWDSHRGLVYQSGKPIDRIIICGGQSTLPGLLEYLGGNLDLPVELGNAWTNMFDSKQLVPPLHLNESLKYVTAIGLALKNFYHD